MERPLSDPELQAELHKYRAAIEEEWGKTTENMELSEEDFAEKTRELLLTATPTAMAVVVNLAQTAESEQVRASCAKYILDNALGKKGIIEPSSPLERLLAEKR